MDDLNAISLAWCWSGCSSRVQQSASNWLVPKGITCFALEARCPRISRAKAWTCSSQAADLPVTSAPDRRRSFPQFLTLTYAAGTIRPANKVVIGAGVGGPAGVATAKLAGCDGVGLRRASSKPSRSSRWVQSLS